MNGTIDMMSHDVVRLQESRGLLPTEQDNIYARPKGSVIDNNLHQRYEGEIQITKCDLPCDQKLMS